MVDLYFVHFRGFSALETAQKLGIPHDDVKGIIEEYSNLNLGTSKLDVPLYEISVSESEKHNEVITIIFFPSRELLEESFYNRELHKNNLPEYKVRLYKGYSQDHSIYFQPTVLKNILIIKNYRIYADHKILLPKTEKSNFIVEFRTLCEDLVIERRNFRNELEKIALQK